MTRVKLFALENKRERRSCRLVGSFGGFRGAANPTATVVRSIAVLLVLTALSSTGQVAPRLLFPHRLFIYLGNGKLTM